MKIYRLGLIMITLTSAFCAYSSLDALAMASDVSTNPMLNLNPIIVWFTGMLSCVTAAFTIYALVTQPTYDEGREDGQLDRLPRSVGL